MIYFKNIVFFVLGAVIAAGAGYVGFQTGYQVGVVKQRLAGAEVLLNNNDLAVPVPDAGEPRPIGSIVPD